MPANAKKLLAVGVVVVLAGYAKGSHDTAASAPAHATTTAATVQSRVIAYAQAQEGKPYLWGAVGPDSYDCSGLVMKAWKHAGVKIQRTTFQQWATERHVKTPKPGDDVFFAGSDGTPSSPGHVGLVVGPHKMIDAYGAGDPITEESFGLPTSRPGLTDPVGYTDPAPQTGEAG